MDYNKDLCGKENCPAGKHIRTINSYNLTITNANRVNYLASNFRILAHIARCKSGRYLYYVRPSTNIQLTCQSTEAILKSRAMILHMEKGDNSVNECNYSDCRGSEITRNRMLDKANIADDMLHESNNKIQSNNGSDPSRPPSPDPSEGGSS